MIYLTADGYTSDTGTTNFIAVISGNLTYSGYQSGDLGDMISCLIQVKMFIQPISSPVSSGTVYASFLVNIHSATYSWGLSFFILLLSFSTSYRARLFVKKAQNGNLAFGHQKDLECMKSSMFTVIQFILKEQLI